MFQTSRSILHSCKGSKQSRMKEGKNYTEQLIRINGKIPRGFPQNGSWILTVQAPTLTALQITSPLWTRKSKYQRSEPTPPTSPLDGFIFCNRQDEFHRHTDDYPEDHGGERRHSLPRRRHLPGARGSPHGECQQPR